MPWDNVGYDKIKHAADDTQMTDDQTKLLRRLCEQKDGVPEGTYDDLSWEISRIDASRRIDQLKKRLGAV